ncbi:hypothetical protein DQ04_10631030 [Trypanosoma grayi]|uniref:hypothetical protein n=1 Tax=Trypanosoma grayi TaxID=71804 RepID=UPI0004F422AD|nr:hypothetical protein DQ04_10631030 [Trypanosoma grayi]KEG07184.1 hypothetical protein DQ04_10631030 [Trypanosoma grayi]
MGRSNLDVEAQLRAWQKTQAKEVPVSFMEWHNLESNLPIVLPLAAVTLVTCIIITLVPFIGRGKSAKSGAGIAHQYAAGLAGTRALIFASRFNPFAFSAFITVWLLLSATNTVFCLMQAASTAATPAATFSETLDGFLKPAVILFVIQYWAITSLLIHVLFTAHRYYIGSAASFPPFLVSFYQVASLKGNEVDRWPVTTVNAALVISVATAIAFTVPWIKNEYRIAMRDLNANAASTLGYRKKVVEKKGEKKRA